QLPTEGPKTLNGLLLEELESFPDASGVALAVSGYHFEVLDLRDNRISMVKACEAA
ncbi:MAG: magnesium/cobalt efflux protein, partial [Pseudomonadales bacterium]|nr:magnesium/cobalt efflux protein [Pseudomonadales bacterium]